MWSKQEFAVILSASAVVFETLGIRQSLGIFLQPVSLSTGWPRSILSWSLALNQLFLGIWQPFAAYIAQEGIPKGVKRTFPVVAISAIIYFIGLAIMAEAMVFLNLGILWAILSGILVGIGMGGTQFSVLLARVAILTPSQTPQDIRARTTRFGIVSGLGQIGQFVFAPIGTALVAVVGWSWTLWIFAIQCLVVVLPLSWILRDEKIKKVQKAGAEMLTIATEASEAALVEQVKSLDDTTEKDAPEASPVASQNLSLKSTLKLAMKSKGYILISVAFFTCGFHIGLLSLHLPAFYVDHGLTSSQASWILSMIGIGSTIATLSVGPVSRLLGKHGVKWMLAGVYYIRGILGIVITLTPWANSTFAGGMILGLLLGFVWLTTVPLTTSMTTTLLPPQHLATLSAFSFLLHQIGAFAGALLGGVDYDMTHSYVIMMWINTCFCFVAGVLVSFV